MNEFADRYREAMLKNIPNVVDVIPSVSFLSIQYEESGTRRSRVFPAGCYIIISSFAEPNAIARTFDFRLRDAIAETIRTCAIDDFKCPTRKNSGIKSPRLFSRVQRVLLHHELITKPAAGTPTAWAKPKEAVLEWWEKMKRGEITPEEVK